MPDGGPGTHPLDTVHTFGGVRHCLRIRTVLGVGAPPHTAQGSVVLAPPSVCYPGPGEAVAGMAPTLPPRGRLSMTGLPALLPDHKQLGL